MNPRPANRLFAAFAAVVSMTPSAMAAPESFLGTIGGSADPHVINKDPPEAIPLTRDARWVIGARFFTEKMKEQPMATAEAAQIAFEQQCRRDGGDLLPNNSASVTDFGKRFISNFSDVVPYKHRVGSLITVCVADPVHVLGAMAAIVFDPSALVANADAGSKVMFAMFRPKLRTAVYAYRGEAIVAPAVFAEREAAAFKRQMEELQKAGLRTQAILAEAAAFQKQVKIGTRTACGLVIDVRGPLAQVQFWNDNPPTAWVPITSLSPERWSCILSR